MSRLADTEASPLTGDLVPVLLAQEVRQVKWGKLFFYYFCFLIFMVFISVADPAPFLSDPVLNKPDSHRGDLRQ